MKTASSHPTFSGNWLNFAGPFFFAVLFFLCGADYFFASRFFGFNFRWGQLLLFACALIALKRLVPEMKNRSSFWVFQWKLCLYWVPFFIVYGLAALFSDSPLPTGTKGGWGLFNIGCALLVVVSPRWDEWMKGALLRGFQWATGLIAGLIWVEMVGSCWFGLARSGNIPDQVSQPVTLSLFSFSVLLGYGQPIVLNEGVMLFRPNAFYYEPSYAGCALAFALPLLMVLEQRGSSSRKGWLPGFVLAAIFLVSSRSGILSAFLGLSIAFCCLLLQKQKKFLKIMAKSLGIGVLLVLLFCATPAARKYVHFIFFPLGVESVSRIHNVATSEGGRFANIIKCLEILGRHPFLGNGLYADSGEGGKGLRQLAMNTWLEIGLESGALGVLAFLGALLAAMRAALKKSFSPGEKSLVLAAWISHLAVNLNLTQTFPRLDYWLLFYFSIYLLTRPAAEKA